MSAFGVKADIAERAEKLAFDPLRHFCTDHLLRKQHRRGRWQGQRWGLEYRPTCDAGHIRLAMAVATYCTRQEQGGDYAYDPLRGGLHENGPDVRCRQPRRLLAPSPHRVLKLSPMSMPRHELVELAGICARNAQIATSEEVARELWKMAREYRQKAADLDHGRHPDTGALPSGMERRAVAEVELRHV